MRNLQRPALAVLLVVLLTTWGTCPCTMAKALGFGPALDATAAGDAVAGSALADLPPC